MTNITTEQVNAEIQRLARANPDAVYRKSGDYCGYTSGFAAGASGCLFGQSLMNLGVEKTVLKGFDLALSPPSIEPLAVALGIKVDENWIAIQSAQDAEVPWGKAVTAKF